MNDQLDLAVRSVLTDIVAAAPAVDEHPLGLMRVVERHEARRPVLAIAAGLLVVIGIAAALAAYLRPDAERPSSPPPSEVGANPDLDRLLHPTATGIRITHALITPSPSGRVAGTVVSPSGSAFGISVMENFWGSLPADFPTQHIGTNTVALGNEDGTKAYSIVNDCLLIGVADRGVTSMNWSGDATGLLAALTVDGADVSIALPDGWTSIGTGSVGTMYILSFVTTAGGVDQSASMYQMPGSPVGALTASIDLPAPVATMVAGRPAWQFHQTDGDTAYLAWDGPNGGVVLAVNSASSQELQSLAATLATGRGADWSTELADEPSNASSPSTPSTLGGLAETGGGCGPKTLTIAP